MGSSPTWGTLRRPRNLNVRFLLLTLVIVACTPTTASYYGTQIPIETALAFPTASEEQLFWIELRALRTGVSTFLNNLRALRADPNLANDKAFEVLWLANIIAVGNAVEFLTGYPRDLPQELNGRLSLFENVLLVSKETHAYMNSSFYTTPDDIFYAETLAEALLPNLDELLELEP